MRGIEFMCTVSVQLVVAVCVYVCVCVCLCHNNYIGSYLLNRLNSKGNNRVWHMYGFLHHRV